MRQSPSSMQSTQVRTTRRKAHLMAIHNPPRTQLIKHPSGSTRTPVSSDPPSKKYPASAPNNRAHLTVTPTTVSHILPHHQLNPRTRTPSVPPAHHQHPTAQVRRPCTHPTPQLPPAKSQQRRVTHEVRCTKAMSTISSAHPPLPQSSPLSCAASPLLILIPMIPRALTDTRGQAIPPHQRRLDGRCLERRVAVQF
jgi:hypothetical protein